MATTNFSGDELKKQTISVLQLHCLPDFTSGIYGQFTFISVLNFILSITAFFGNALVLIALRKESSLHPPSKVLLRNLATTDLFVGLISQALYAALLVPDVNEHSNVCRYVAVAVAITSFILCAVGCVHCLFNNQALFEFCYKVMVRNYSYTLCLVTSTFSYTKIFVNLRNHQNQNQVQDQVQQPNQSNQLNIARYRKAVSTALWLQLMLVACYLSYVMISLNLRIHAEPSLSVSVAWNYTFTLLFLKLDTEPDSLLLEDGRSETCSKGHNQTSSLLLIELGKNHSKQWLTGNIL